MSDVGQQQIWLRESNFAARESSPGAMKSNAGANSAVYLVGQRRSISWQNLICPMDRVGNRADGGRHTSTSFVLTQLSGSENRSSDQQHAFTTLGHLGSLHLFALCSPLLVGAAQEPA